MMKKIGGTYYVHKSNIRELLNFIHDDKYKKEIIRLYEFKQKSFYFPYEVIKYDTKYHKLSFIDSPDWYTANEPIVGDSTCYNLDDDTITYRRGGIQVYHSKELFMADDTDLIDLEKAKERTRLWNSLVSKEDKKKIGNKKFWHRWCTENKIKI